MDTQELIKSYKLQYTPMEKNADILLLYRDYKETGALEADNIYRILIETQPLNIHLSMLEKLLEEKRSRSYIQLFTEFLEKWREKGSYFTGFSKATVFEKMKEVVDKLLTFDPEYITFELTDDCSVFFQSLVNDKNIYLELFFTKDVEEGFEIVTNIYQDRKNIFAYGGSIEDTFSKIKTRISQYHWYIEPTASFYGVSKSSFTETTV